MTPPPDLGIALAIAAFAVTEASLLPVLGSRATAVALAALIGLLFVLWRRSPVAVAAAVSATEVLRSHLDALPVGSYAYGAVAHPLIFFGAVAFGARAQRVPRLAAVTVLSAVVVGDSLLAYVGPGTTDEVRLTIVLESIGYGLCGAVLGWMVRDRTDDLRRLQARVAELVARLPERPTEAALAEHRRISADLESLAGGLLTRVDGLLREAGSVASSRPDRARAALTEVAAAARAALEGMRELVWRLDSTGVAVRTPALDDVAPAPERSGPREALSRVATMVSAHPMVALLLAYAVVDQLVHPKEAPLALRLAIALVVPLPLLARHRAPLLSVATVSGLALAGTAAGALGGLTFLQVLAALVCAFVAGSSIPGLARSAGAGALVVGLALLGFEIDPAPWPTQLYLTFAAILAGVWLGGRATRERLEGAQAARAEIDELREVERDARRRAVRAERARLAREIHDLLGHAVLVVVFQAETAARQLESRTAAAIEAIEGATEATGSAIGELRRLAELTPDEAAPGLDEVPVLVDRLRRSGLEVDLRLDVHQPVHVALGRAVYRILQEALTNVAKHAPGGRAEVAVQSRGGRLDVVVRNPRRGPGGQAGGGGRGLPGMRDRAAEHGGSLVAAPDGAGGWTVAGSFPLD